MKKHLLIISIFAFSISLFSQSIKKDQLDRLFNDFIKSKNISKASGSEIKQVPVKCGFVLVNSVKTHINEFSNEQQQILKPLITRPVLQTSIVSPSGFFRIHYDTTGNNTPAYYTDTDLLHYSKQELLQIYLDSVAIAADSTYNFEINNLGYPPPPSDDTAGGDNKYDIYLKSLGWYGETDFDGDKGPSYIVVNSDFTGFRTLGIYAVRVTVAHEFHHGIQVGNYIYRETDAWFHELTSTSFEHFVYPSIHDYYNYMSHYFENPQRSIASNDVNGGDGYDLAIWNIYLQKKFDYGIIKMQWEMMPSMRAIEAINKSIIDLGNYFSEILNEFGIWVYYTHNRAQQGKYFPEAENYPAIIIPISNSLQFPPYVSINSFNYPASNNYFKISIKLPSEVVNSLFPIITNSDYKAAVVNTASTFSLQYNLYNYNAPGTTELDSNYYFKLNTSESTWFNSAILYDTVIVPTRLNYNAYFPFPSPFNYSYSVLYIPVDQNSTGEYNLNVYSIGMKLVYSSTVPLIKLDKVKPVVIWNGKDNNNQKLSSGVYIYAVKSGNNVKKGKIVIFNE
jgi:hypothetical protein